MGTRATVVDGFAQRLRKAINCMWSSSSPWMRQSSACWLHRIWTCETRAVTTQLLPPPKPKARGNSTEQRTPTAQICSHFLYPLAQFCACFLPLVTVPSSVCLYSSSSVTTLHRTCRSVSCPLLCASVPSRPWLPPRHIPDRMIQRLPDRHTGPTRPLHDLVHQEKDIHNIFYRADIGDLLVAVKMVRP